MSYVDDSDDLLIRFSPCQRSSCAVVSIEDDDVVEKIERIVIRLERTVDLNSRIRFGISSGVIEVEDDNDGMCCNVYWLHIPVSFQMTLSISSFGRYLQWLGWDWRRRSTHSQKTQL